MLDKTLIHKKNLDHRQISQDMSLYFFEEKAGRGLPFLLSDWVTIRNQIVQFLQKKQKSFGFQEVITPILGNENLYKTSGHLIHYKDYIFSPFTQEKDKIYLRPMTCPHHCLIYKQNILSYRDLPLRLFENSVLHRYESSGGLKGLERARWMELADHHIFVTPEQLKDEFKKNYFYITEILNFFNFQTSLICALHDPEKSEKFHPDKKIWDFSENILIDSLIELGIRRKKNKFEKGKKFEEIKGGAAFYGPKLDFEVKNIEGKSITLATIQLDFILAKKFGLKYKDKNQKNQIPIIIHQSPIGTYQRFISLLLEQNQGELPFWLAPSQVAIFPINKKKKTKIYCENLFKNLEKIDLRVKMVSNIQQIYKKRIPYYLSVGEKEIKSKLLKLNFISQKREKKEILTEKELIKKLKKEKVKL